MTKIKIGSASVNSGEVAFVGLKISELNDGSPIEVPICIINGHREGPCLWIQNGVHGDEYVGAAAIHQLIQNVDVNDITGSLILIPVLNMQAFRAGTRMAPQDGLDMNRIWPGAPLERAMHLWTHSELVVHEVIQLIKEYADALLDVHDAGWMGLMSPYAAYYNGPNEEFENKVRDLALASGMDLIWETKSEWVAEKVPGSIKTQMTRAMIPSITLEVGGEGRTKKVHVDRMYQSFIGIMNHMNMIDREIPRPETQIRVNKGKWVRAPMGGFLYIHVEPLEKVEKGDPLATITDLFGRERKTLTSPQSGWIVGTRTFGTVQTGQYITNVAQ